MAGISQGFYGPKELKEELFLIRDWHLKKENLGNKRDYLPRGILFYGLPGYGKTFLSREYAASFNCPVFVIEGDSEKVEQEINSVYKKARNEKMAVVIIDELDSLVDKNPLTTRMLQTMLDGYVSNDNVLTIATANDIIQFPEALLREGRFDRKFDISKRNRADYRKIVDAYCDKLGLSFTEDEKEELVDAFNHTAPSEIQSIFSNAALRYGEQCTVEDMIVTINSSDTGFANRQNDGELTPLYVCIHEVGHALYTLRHCEYHKFLRLYFDDQGGKTIVTDKHDFSSRQEMIEKIKIALAGIAAEDLFAKKHSYNCTDDLEKAKKYANLVANHQSAFGVDYILTERDCYRPQNLSEFEKAYFARRTAKLIKRCYGEVRKALRKDKKAILAIGLSLQSEKQLSRGGLLNLLGEKSN